MMSVGCHVLFNEGKNSVLRSWSAARATTSVPTHCLSFSLGCRAFEALFLCLILFKTIHHLEERCSV